MSVVVITPPAAPIIDVPTARARLALDTSVSDTTLEALISAAQAMIDGPEGILGRAIGMQTLELRQPAWGSYPDHWRWWGGYAEFGPVPNYIWDFERCHPNWRMWCDRSTTILPFGPLASVTSVTYLDQTGMPQVLDPSAYQVFDVGAGLEGHIAPVYGTTWPGFQLQRDAIKVRYVAGYATPPAPIVQAVLMMARNLSSLSGRDPFTKSEQVTGVGSTNYDTGSGAGAAVNSAIEAMLAPYRLPSL